MKIILNLTAILLSLGLITGCSMANQNGDTIPQNDIDQGLQDTTPGTSGQLTGNDTDAQTNQNNQTEQTGKTGQTNQTNQATTSSQRISENEAKGIALKKAGLSESDVKFEKVELDKDDGVWHYDIEFRYGTKEYEAEIKADDGTILDWDIDNI